MNRWTHNGWTRVVPALTALGCMAMAVGVFAEEQAFDEQSPWRLELALGLQSWPGLGDLAAADGGSFDGVGFNLSAAAHYSVRKFDDSELLVGGDIGFMSNESSIDLYFGELTARAMYLGPSLKWVFGQKHSYSVDAGITYWDVDFAEVAADYVFYYEHVAWKDDAVGAYLGATWDVGSDDPLNTGGMSLSAKAHFVDFGEVTGNDPVLQEALGPNPGSLVGPVFQVQIGYRWR